MVQPLPEDKTSGNAEMTQRAISLLYHDVISGVNTDCSGFSGKDAADYKINVDDFGLHLDAIEKALAGPVVSSLNVCDDSYQSPPVLFTFDDGGVSAYDTVAPLLESRGWRGVFFVTTDRIDTPSFLSSCQILELHERGHVIGSHSCSHPLKISNCTDAQLLREWRDSINILSGIIGETVYLASVPGGFYTRRVAESAAQAGVRQLFTSEPVQKIQKVENCWIIGRFSVKRGAPAQLPVDIVVGNPLTRIRQFAYWNTKKVAKTLAGPLYSRLRKFILAGR